MMRLLDRLLRRFCRLIMGMLVYTVNMTKRRYRECAVIASGGIILVVAVLCVNSFAGGGKNKVYAVQSPDKENEREGEMPSIELKAGLMGLVDSVSCMEKYSQAISSVSIQNGCENILVGTFGVKRGALNRQWMSQELKTISGIGYYALMEIRNNQMPKTEYNSLLQIVEAEATGGDLKSKILIANVVLNRVRDSRFPDSIYDVVFQRSGQTAQFSPVEDGRIYSVTITEDTIEAVDRALDGEDYSEGALFFMARESSDDSNVEWFDSKLKPLFSYGGHEYFTYND